MIPVSGCVLTAAQMHDAEIASGISLQKLMDRAGCALAEAVWRFGSGRPALILCGPGNNGGDGYIAARLLAAWGVDVSIAASGFPKTELAVAARAAWDGLVGNLANAQSSPVLVDALFGTGLTRELPAEIAKPLHRLANAAEIVIAADLPSGVGTDDGRDYGAARADITLAFAAAKPAHLLQPAASLCGKVRIAHIGVECVANVSVLARPHLAQPGPTDHKYTRGMVIVVGGTMPGAAALSATAAARSGAGYVVGIGVTGDLPHAIVRRDHDELANTLDDPRVRAVVIGPGLGRSDRAREMVDLAIASPCPLVLDGDALAPNVVNDRPAPTILTPHAGEFTRMFGDGDGSKLDRTRAAADHCGATIIFKGADTVIASPGGRATLCPPASAWLSTAGTGDVLAGIAGAMLARGFAPHDAACAAVWLHSEAARLAGSGMIADDLLTQLPRCL
ncbi:NAD(P)H-hydrate dehydratase [Sphingomonas paeninsulae]|uniref:Bifunctional NAD(P)H-hydrate repair enzyme n=2 Tax=Sphingomonas paeninsulae TaxID=2319844 RepID=A0A494TDE9_SPHPE|nr:NAD(P)H-hydrate dehydratase [Sphingomonas paeninsulae]